MTFRVFINIAVLNILATTGSYMSLGWLAFVHPAPPPPNPQHGRRVVRDLWQIPGGSRQLGECVLLCWLRGGGSK